MSEWKIVYGKYCKAVEVVYDTLTRFVDYVPECNAEETDKVNVIYCGTDSKTDGYKIEVKNTGNGMQRVQLTAKDEIYLLYAAHDFTNKYIPYARNADRHCYPFYFYDIFGKDPLKEFCKEFKPRIKMRGIWTWSIIINNYKKYIDNMAALKLNTLILWDDYVPGNIDDVIKYAHENGISVYPGYAWGWENGPELMSKNLNSIDELSQSIYNTFCDKYLHLECDGIYFQSFTETADEDYGGRNIAEAVVELVNKTSKKVFAQKPELKLYFGLHATSVKNRTDVIAKTDPRVTIVWEDCGAFPYAYVPCKTENFAQTVEFTESVKNLNGGGFGAVLKGICDIDWETFSHQTGEHIIGTQSDDELAKKLEAKKDILRYTQAYWTANAGYAHELIKHIDDDSMVTVLTTAFDSAINLPTALFAEMLWDSGRTTDEILVTTMLRPDVRIF